MQEGEVPKAQPPLQELTIDMIKPTEDNEIPPNGIFPEEDAHLGSLWKKFIESLSNPSDVAARFKYLDYIRKRGDLMGTIAYLSELKQRPELYNLSPENKLKETQILAEAFMNAAEAQRRRDEDWRKPRGLNQAAPTREMVAIRLLRISLEYQEAANKLRQQLQSQAQQK